MRLAYLLVVSLLIALIPLAPMVAGQTVSEQEAYQAFVEGGCTECHDGVTAPDWNATVEKIREWATMYATIDEAVQNEYTFQGGADSYAEMMQAMRDYTQGITDQQYQILYEYFLQVFQVARAQFEQSQTTTPAPSQGECTGETVTVTTTITKTRTKTVTETLTMVVKEKEQQQVLVTVPVEPPEARETPTTMAYAPILAALLAFAGLAYLYLALAKTVRS